MNLAVVIHKRVKTIAFTAQFARVHKRFPHVHRKFAWWNHGFNLVLRSATHGANSQFAFGV
jgi:hypothetical protein